MRQYRKKAIRSFLFFILLSSCYDNTAVKPINNSPLVHIGNETIGEKDFLLALEKLNDDVQSLTLSDWRQRLQVLIDNELMLIEAQRRELHEDDKVKAAVKGWERDRIISVLREKSNLGTLTPNTKQITTFFETTGAANEIKLQRIDVTDRYVAVSIIKKLNSGNDFADIAKKQNKRILTTDWLNPLMVDERYAPLFFLQKGDVELLEAEGRFIVAQITEQRMVSLEERKKIVERSLQRKLIQEANLNLLAELAEKYNVQIDTTTAGQLLKGNVNNEQRLLTSSLGEWTVDQYILANKSLPNSDKLQVMSIRDLGFRITRVFIVDQVFAEEKQNLGMAQSIDIEKQKFLKQKMLEAMWQTDIYSQIIVENFELQAFYQKHKTRYSALSKNMQALNNQLTNDIRESKAQPLFVSFIENLRSRSENLVKIEEDNFRDFVSRQRKKQVPVDL